MKTQFRSAAAVGFIAMLVLSACSNGQGSSSPSSSAASSPGAQLSQPLEHIHGAAVDAATGAVIAGTHHGVWRIAANGEVIQAGQSQDDFMGFTIATPSRWYASGHPGSGSSAPNPLGLITSTDNGKTWTDVSLTGEVDFHALAVSANTIAGYDSAAGLMISADSGRTWNKGMHIRPASLTFSGTSLLAATDQGLLVSSDSGATFTPIVNAPRAVLLSAVGSAVWCVDTNGHAWSSPDAGATWSQQGTVGQVSAIAAIGPDSAYTLTPTTLTKLS